MPPPHFSYATTYPTSASRTRLLKSSQTMTNHLQAKRAHDADDAAKDERLAKRVSNINDFDNMVTVLVGQEEKRFTLHQDAVCDKSKFFKAACAKRWLEGQERVVRLPEVKPVDFQTYCSWIYTGQVADGTCTTASTNDERRQEYDQTIQLYLLADKLDDIQLRNRATVKLFHSMRSGDQLVNSTAINLVWESTLIGSPLRKMLVDTYITRLSRAVFAKNISLYPAEFVKEIALAALHAAPLRTWEELANALSSYAEPEGTS